jgi:tetratricopeptide (TPR) repeat protein
LRRRGIYKNRFVLAACLLALMLAGPLRMRILLNLDLIQLHKVVSSGDEPTATARAIATLQSRFTDSSSPAAARHLAFIALASGDPNAALSYAQHAGSNPLAAWLQGQAYSALGREAEALAAWRAAGAAPYFVAAAQTALQRRDLDAARQGFQRAQAIGGQPAQALAGLGEIAVLERDPTTALQYFSAALAHDPNLHRVHFMTARVLQEEGRSEEAFQHLLRAASLEPGIGPYVDALVVAYLERGDAANAALWRAQASTTTP